MTVISLVPSITELLHDLGLGDEVIGITKFCVHPEKWFRTKTKIGGTKNIDIEKIKSLQPDIIIANKEENVKEQVEQLNDFSVLLTDVNNYDEAIEMIKSIGSLVNKPFQANQIINDIQESFSLIQTEKEKSAAYLIWKNPYMTIGGDTFIHSMMQKAGFKNVFANQKRYPEVSLDDIQQLHPEYIFLSTEPYPFKEKHIAELRPHFSNSKIILADGEMFSWYGSRMIKAAEYFASIV